MLQKCIEVLLYVRQKKFFGFLRCCCQKRHASFAWKWVNDTFFNWWCDLWNRVSRGLKNTRAWFLDCISKHVAMHLTRSMSRVCVFLRFSVVKSQRWQLSNVTKLTICVVMVNNARRLLKSAAAMFVWRHEKSVKVD